MNVMLHPAPVPEHAARFIAKPLQLLIGGEWVHAASGKTFDVFDPSTGQPIAKAAEGDAADIDRAVAAARAAFEAGPWPRMSPLERSKLIWRLGDALEAHAEEFAALEALDNGKPIRDARAVDVPGSYEMFRYMSGWGHAVERRDRADLRARKLARLYAARTGRRGRPDHPVEFSPHDGGLEAGARACRRLHHRAEAGRANAALGRAARPVDFGSRFPARRCQCRHRLWRDRRGSAGGASGRGQGGVHRVDRSGQADRAGGCRQSEESLAGTRWQIAGDRVRRRGHGCSDPRHRQCDLLQYGPVLHRRLAALRA